MVEQDQVRPLAPATTRQSSDDGEVNDQLKKLMRRRFMIKCCGCTTAFLLIEAVVILILIFTVFRVKDPIIKLNGVTITKLELINNTIPKPGTNMSLTADVSVKNPNVASFKYTNTTTTLYYQGKTVGEARGPPGRAKARRTMKMNITVVIITDQLISSPSLRNEVSSGLLTMNSFSKISGRVKIMSIIKKHVIVKMNCTMTVNITSQAIQKIKCKRKVSL